MSDAPFPLHVDVFLAGTGRLSPTDLGAYLRLLLELWKEDGYLPMNHAHLCRLTGITPKRWEPTWQALSCFFDVFDGRLSQKRVLFELNLRAQRARAGAEGGLAKAKQTSSKPLANPWQTSGKTLAKGSTALEPPLITSENYLSADCVNSDSSTRQEKGGGGFEVPVSGSVSLSGPVSPGRTSQPPIREDRQSDEPRRRQLREPEYPAEFEAIWAACDKQGSKADALKAWEQVGRPAHALAAASWAQWKRVRWFDGIGVPHVSTWLRKFGWKEEPEPRLGATGPVLSDRERGNRSALEAFVRNGQGAKR